MVTSGTHGWEPNEAKYHRAVWAPEKIIALPSGKMSGQAPGLIAAVAEERGLEPMLAAQQM